MFFNIIAGKTETHVLQSLKLIESVNSPLQLSFSGGKDSTALLALFLLAKKYGFIKNFEVVHSNTLMEMPFLDKHVQKMQRLCDKNGVAFHFLSAPLKDRFFYNILGRGVAIPNRNFRWCTDKLKIKPIKNFLHPGAVMVNGERLGESINRDIKLNSQGCGNSGECGLEEHKKISDFILRPLLNWSTCQVWDFIALADMGGVIPKTFNDLSEIYSINQKENSSMRTGCIGCPLVSKDKSLIAFVEKNHIYAPLIQVQQIYNRLKSPEYRLLRWSKRSPNGHPGCIKLSSRLQAYIELLEIESQVKKQDPNFVLIDDIEKQAIKSLLFAYTYPSGYSKKDKQVIDDINEFLELVVLTGFKTA